MYEISKIKLPDGITYNIKDTYARNMLEHSLELVVCPDGNFPGPAGPDYEGKIYLLPHQHGTNDVYDEYVVVHTINPAGYSWEKIGNTDIDMSNYSLKTHKHTVTTNISVAAHTITPAGTIAWASGVQSFVGTPAIISLTGQVSGDIEISVDTQTPDPHNSGYYVPTGTVSININSDGSHSHTIGGTTKYLRKVTIPKAFDTETAVTAIATSKLVKTQIKAVTGTASVSRLTGSTQVAVAQAGSAVSIPKIDLAQNSTIVHSLASNAISTGNRATGELSSSTVAKGANTPMWNAKIDDSVGGDPECLVFEFKSISTANTVTGVTPSRVEFKQATLDQTPYSLVPAISNGTVNNYSKTDITVAITDNTPIPVATGAVNANATGDEIATGATTQSVLKQVASTNGTENVFGSIQTTQQTGDEPIITAVNAATGTDGAHTHRVSGTFTGDGVEFTGALDPGTITASGNYTPEGTVNNPVFTGTQATLEHTVNGNGTYNTSQADS